MSLMSSQNSPSEKQSAWRVLSERTVLSTPFLKVRVEQVALPDGKIVDDYYQIDMDDFVAIFAQIASGEVVVLRQYKHGPRKVSMTFPGGQVEAGESPIAAARRELLEETGMVSARWRDLGSYVVSSNQRCARGYFFHALDCRVVQPPCSGDLEEIKLELTLLDDVFAAARRGEIAIVNQMTLLTLATHPLLADAFEEISE